MELEPQRRPPAPVLLDEPIEEEELWTDDGEEDHSGWFCVATKPFPCPAPGCAFVAEFMTAAHLILVWQDRDDPNLLRHAQRAKEVGRNPRLSTSSALLVRAPPTTPGKRRGGRYTPSAATDTSKGRAARDC